MEWAREVEMGIEGRRVGVQGPAVTMIVLAGQTDEPDSDTYDTDVGSKEVHLPCTNCAPFSWAKDNIEVVNL